MMPRLKLTSQRSVFEAKMVRNHKLESADKVRSLPRACGGWQMRGKFVTKNGGLVQKVAVNIVYKKFGFSVPTAYVKSLRTNAAYITRGGALDAVDESGTTLMLQEVHEKTRGWDDDQRYYRFIISPEEGHKLDLEKFTAEVMAKAREDLLTRDELSSGVQIEWVMAQHWDTDHPHVHVMMRGKVGERDVHLSGGYTSYGLRSRAEEVATVMLGYRREQWREIDLTEEQKKLREKAINEAKLPELKERRAERGLDPETGKHPDEAAATDGGKDVSKSKETSRDMRGFDGGIE